MAILLPVRSLHLSAANVHHSGVKELSGPTKGATETYVLIFSFPGPISLLILFRYKIKYIQNK